MEKKQRFNWGMSRVGKQLPWHSPERDVRRPRAYCAKTNPVVSVSLDKGDSQCYCAKGTGLSEHKLARVCCQCGRTTDAACHLFIHSFIL